MRASLSASGPKPCLARSALCAGALALATACGVYQAGTRTGDYAAQNLPPVDPAQVQLYGGDNPGLGGKEVGFVVGVSDVEEEWLATQRLRSAAAKMGADAVVDLRFEVIQSSRIVARGRAIRRGAVPATPGQAPPSHQAPFPPSTAQPSGE